jgi:hypothetical protein
MFFGERIGKLPPQGDTMNASLARIHFGQKDTFYGFSPSG